MTESVLINAGLIDSWLTTETGASGGADQEEETNLRSKQRSQSALRRERTNSAPPINGFNARLARTA